MKYLLIFALLFGLLFAFDKNEFYKEISNFDSNNSVQMQNLINLSSQWQEANIKNLKKLKEINDEKKFIDNFLLEKTLTFLYLNLSNKQKSSDNFDKISNLFANYFQEQVDFLIQNKSEFKTDFEKFKDLKPCVGDSCGHFTEIFTASAFLKDAKSHINSQNYNEINRILNDSYRHYKLLRIETELVNNYFNYLNSQFFEKIHLELTNFNNKYSQRLKNLQNYFFNYYLTNLYAVQYLTAFNYKSFNKFEKEDLFHIIRKRPKICNFTNLLSKELIEFCNKEILRNSHKNSKELK